MLSGATLLFLPISIPKSKVFLLGWKFISILKGYSGDVIMVMSLQDKEQKMHHADFFLNDAPDLSHPVDNRIFHAIACLATHSISTTGWDWSHIQDGMAPEFLTNICLGKANGALDMSP